jgi:hypothetical protein
MLTYEQLRELEQTLRGRRVLSVYVDGGATDAAGRGRWRHRLEREAGLARAALDMAPAAERAAFDRCVARLTELLPPTIVALYPPGWVAFIEPDGARYAGSLHVAAPTTVTWRDGIRAAPYLRALKQHQRAAAAVVDSTRGRIYRYIHGALERVQTVHAQPRSDQAGRISEPLEGGFPPGTGGHTATDEVERVRRAGASSMLRDVGRRLTDVAGADGWILLGGTREAVRELMSALPKQLVLGHRVRVLSELDGNATDARVAAAAERGATLQRRAHDRAMIDEVIDHALSDGNGTLGSDTTLRALRDDAVERLFLSERFLREHPDDSEELVRAAFDHGARVEQASGEAARRLDDEAGGVGARLRYVLAARN